ncbi:LuxR C-terminal-related transcriptional regulator [Arthrobacter sp. L77]|uniref:LuxR C-terminal-related transcriptional regulator n=1 Tax=Arthrobacter sp. L77 TaxID=1496689 RepID=UPI00068CBB31|nr:LuxR C-terminal-related transcriptional regulator [Arthrobacter sp. L77]
MTAHDVETGEPSLHDLPLDAATYEVVLALCLGFSIPGLVPPLLYNEGVPAEQLAAEARAAGLVRPDGRPTPELRASMLRDADPYQVRRLQRALVDLYCSESLPLGPLARRLAADGLVDGRVAGVLVEEGTSLLGTDPAAALDLLERAVHAGADAVGTAPRRAEAAFCAGDLDAASRILDTYFGHGCADPEPVLPDAARAVRVASALWAHRGMMSRAADVHRWAAGAGATGVETLGALALLATGDAAGARAMASGGASAASPSLVDVAHLLLAEGALQSLGPDPSGAVPLLIRSSDTLDASGRVSPAPELPACLAAIVALLAGHHQTALAVIQAALASGQGGRVSRPRLCLLGGWAAMLMDQPALARDFCDEAGARDQRLAPRDHLLLQALEVGLARRAGDSAALVQAWQRAREALLHVSVDLLTVLPFTELVIAAARLRDSDALRPHLDEAWALLSTLGNPPLWSVPLHWSATQAALLLERPGDLAPHAAALVHQPSAYPLAATFALAGKAWVSVLAGRFDTGTVEAAAQGLAAAGFAWEGARLAGHAAARADDRRDMTRLLSCARDLRPARERITRPDVGPSPAAADPPGGRTPAGARTALPHRTAGAGPATRGPATDGAGAPGADAGMRGPGVRRAGGPALSAREREIAQLVLQGRTYREISEEIFISPRTVEHHVARIRRRVGASSRSDLLARLRLSLGTTSAEPSTAAPPLQGRGPDPLGPPDRGR